MLLLAFDVSGSNCAVALARGDGDACEFLARNIERLARNHAERLMPLIEATLAQAGLGFTDVDRIAVTTGPGSFTGIRVGVAAARALALALAIPACGIGSLSALASEAMRSAREGTAVALVGAQEGRFHVCAHDIASGAVVIEPSTLALQEAALRLSHASRPLVLTGHGAAEFSEALGEEGLMIAGTADAPDIASVAMLGLRAVPDGPPVPLYMRDADAKPQTQKAVARA